VVLQPAATERLTIFEGRAAFGLAFLCF